MENALDLTMTLWLLVRLLVASLIGAALLSVPVKTYTEELLPKLMALRGVRIEKVD